MLAVTLRSSFRDALRRAIHVHVMSAVFIVRPASPWIIRSSKGTAVWGGWYGERLAQPSDEQRRKPVVVDVR